jgi:hypothetical protein
MNIIVGARRSGKTTEIVKEWLLGGPTAVLMVIDETDRAALIQRYELTPEQQARVVLPHRSLQGRTGPLYIDNLALVLASKFGITVLTASDTFSDIRTASQR